MHVSVVNRKTHISSSNRWSRPYQCNQSSHWLLGDFNRNLFSNQSKCWNRSSFSNRFVFSNRSNYTNPSNCTKSPINIQNSTVHFTQSIPNVIPSGTQVTPSILTTVASTLWSEVTSVVSTVSTESGLAGESAAQKQQQGKLKIGWRAVLVILVFE